MILYPTLAALLPEVEKADFLFNDAIERIRSDGDFKALVDKYNETLVKAVDAIYEDTKHVNSKSTLIQVFSPREKYDLYFGVNPLLVLQKLVEKDFVNVG